MKKRIKMTLALLLALGGTATPAFANEVSVLKANTLGFGVGVNVLNSKKVALDAIAIGDKNKIREGAALTFKVFHNVNIGAASIYQNGRRGFSRPEFVVSINLI